MSELPGKAADYFGEMSAEYDSLIQRAVPRYAEMTERLLAYLPPQPESEGPERILELGCGTGNLSLKLAAARPGAVLSFVDASQQMLDVTRHRLTEQDPEAAERATFVRCPFEDLFEECTDQDLIVSCISLHHVHDKPTLYHSLASFLKPGGHLVFSDQLAGATERLSALNWKGWTDFASQPDHASAEELQSLIDHAHAHDFYTPIAEHFRLMTQAGFVECDCVWRNYMWGILSARRAD